MTIPIDVPKEEIYETPLMPDGTVCTSEISKVEVKESKNADYKGAHVLALSCDVIKADNQKYLGVNFLHNVCIPSQAYKDGMNPKGWAFIRDNWARICKIFGIKNVTNVDENVFFGKKFLARVGSQEYPEGSGKRQNTIADIVKLV